MKCLANNMIIVREKSDAEKNGILLPENARKEKPYGEVICVGPDCKNVAVGDRVLIPLLTLMRMRQTGVCDLEVELVPGKPEPALVVKEEDVAVVWEKDVEGIPCEPYTHAEPPVMLHDIPEIGGFRRE